MINENEKEFETQILLSDEIKDERVKSRDEFFKERKMLMLGCYDKKYKVIYCIVDNFKPYMYIENILIDKIVDNIEHELIHYCIDKLKVEFKGKVPSSEIDHEVIKRIKLSEIVFEELD